MITDVEDTSLEPWKLIDSKYIVNDRWLKLRSNTYVTPAGHTIEPYYIIENSDWVNCFVIDNNLDVVMVKQYRPAANKYIPELVSGEVEPTDVSPEAGMKRELEEEIGYVGGEIRQTGVCYANPARQNNKISSFIAFGGSCAQKQQLEKGETLHVVKISFTDFLKTFSEEKTDDTYQSTHLAAIFFALNFLRETTLPELHEFRAILEGSI